MSLAQSADELPISHGSLLDLANDTIGCLRRAYREHGLISALVQDDQRIVFAFGPELNQQLLTDTNTYHSRFFALRGPRNSSQRRLTSGLLSMNGEDHKRNRRLVMGPFQKKAIESYRLALADLTNEMLASWRPGQVRDIYGDMTRYMLRVTSSVLFGFDQTELAYSIGHLIERWVTMNHELGMAAFVPAKAVVNEYDGLLSLADQLETRIRSMIEFRRADPHSGDDVLSLLLRAHDERGIGLTDEELIGQATVLFAAAHLTTAATLTWTMFLLSQHPRVAADLCDELNGVLDGNTPTVEQMEQLPLLDRVLKESMRVLPASSYSQRVTSQPTELGPFQLTRGTPVVFSQFITHRMPELYTEADRFRPERWESIAPSPYAYLPFAAGPRMCLGAGLATMTIKVTVPAILQRFRLSMVPGANVNGKVISTMLTPISGMPMLVLPPTAPPICNPVGGNIHELMELGSSARQTRRAA